MKNACTGLGARFFPGPGRDVEENAGYDADDEDDADKDADKDDEEEECRLYAPYDFGFWRGLLIEDDPDDNDGGDAKNDTENVVCAEKEAGQGVLLFADDDVEDEDVSVPFHLIADTLLLGLSFLCSYSGLWVCQNEWYW